MGEKRIISGLRAKRWLKAALWTVLGLWAVLLIVLQIVLNSSVLTRIADTLAKEYVDGDVAFSGIKASMFKSFPNLNVTVDGFTVTYPHEKFAEYDSLSALGVHLSEAGRNPEADTLAHFNELSVSINYLSAITGKIRVRRAVLKHPRIFAHQYDSVKANWNILGISSSKDGKDTSSSGLPPVSIGKVSLEERPFVVYTNPSDTIFGCIFLKEMSAKGRFDSRKGKLERVALDVDSLTLAGRLPADTIAMRFDRIGVKERTGHLDVDIRSKIFLALRSAGRMEVPVDIEGDFHPNFADKIFSVNKLKINVATIGLEAKGKADLSGENPKIKAEAAIRKTSIKALADCFGENFPMLRKLDTDALLTLDAKCDGEYSKADGRLPRLSVRLQVPDSRIGWEGIDGQGRFDLDATATSSEGRLIADIPDFCFSLKGTEISLSGRAEDLLAPDPEFSLSSDIHVELDSLTGFLPDSLGITAHGDLEGIIEGGFRLSQLDAFNFSEMDLEGLLESNGIRFSLPGDSLYAYLGHTDISLGEYSHSEEDADEHEGHDHSHKGLVIAVDSLFAEYGATTFIRGTGLEISAHNSEEAMEGTPGKHPLHGHLDIASVGMMDLDSCFIGARGSANTFKLTHRLIDGHTVPYLSFSSNNKGFTMREGVNRVSVNGIKLSAEAHPNEHEAKARKKHLLDSLQKVYPGVQRDSLFRKAFRRRQGGQLPDYLSEKDFEKKDIHIQIGESMSGYIKNWDLSGSVAIAEGKVISPYYPLDNTISGFSGKFTNNRIDLSSLNLRSGVSDISAKGSLSGIKRLLTSGKGKLDLNIAITSDLIDVNEILVALNSGKNFVPPGHNTALDGIGDDEYLNEVKERSAADTTAATPLVVIPSNLNAKVTLEANTIKYSKLETSWVSTEIVMKERCLQATNTLATTNMGDIYLEGFYSTRTKKDITAGFDLNLATVTAEKVIDMFPAVDSIVPMLKAFKGVLDCEVAATASIDTSMNIILPSLNGIVTIDGKDLALAESEELDRLRRTLMFKDKDSSNIGTLAIRGIIKDNSLEIFPFVLDIDRYSVAASGLQNFDQKFNYHLSAIKSPIPFRFGVNLNGSFSDWRWRLGRTKYKSKNIPLFDKQVEGLRVNLVSAIHNIFERGVDQALKQNEKSQEAIEERKTELEYSTAPTEDLSEAEKQTVKTLENVVKTKPEGEDRNEKIDSGH